MQDINIRAPAGFQTYDPNIQDQGTPFVGTNKIVYKMCWNIGRGMLHVWEAGTYRVLVGKTEVNRRLENLGVE